VDRMWMLARTKIVSARCQAVDPQQGRTLTIGTGATRVNCRVRAGTHYGLVAVFGSHPEWWCAVRAQHLDDLDNSVIFPNDPAVHHKSVADAGVHERSLVMAGYSEHAAKAAGPQRPTE
jgi:hypothetical protein